MPRSRAGWLRRFLDGGRLFLGRRRAIISRRPDNRDPWRRRQAVHLPDGRLQSAAIGRRGVAEAVRQRTNGRDASCLSLKHLDWRLLAGDLGYITATRPGASGADTRF